MVRKNFVLIAGLLALSFGGAAARADDGDFQPDAAMNALEHCSNPGAQRDPAARAASDAAQPAPQGRCGTDVSIQFHDPS